MKFNEEIFNGLRQADFQEWKHHPVSKLYRRFIEDFRDASMREITGRWLAGTLDDKTSMEGRGRVLAYLELLELEFESIAAFYQEQEQSDDEHSVNDSTPETP